MTCRRANGGDGGGRGERSDGEGGLKDGKGGDEGGQREVSHELNIRRLHPVV